MLNMLNLNRSWPQGLTFGLWIATCYAQGKCGIANKMHLRVVTLVIPTRGHNVRFILLFLDKYPKT
jgi:hypothetical protein